MYYSGRIPLKLTEEEEQRLLDSLSETEDVAVRNKLIEHNLRFVIYIAEKFEDTSGTTLEELVSVGEIGLIKGVRAFRPEMDVKLATYLSHCIENEIRVYLRHEKRGRRDLSIERTFFRDSCGRAYSLSEVLSTEQDFVSRQMENEVLDQALREAVARLPRREQMIVRLRFGLDEKDEKRRTQQEIADLLGISQSYVSRLERRILLWLRKEMAAYR